MSVTCSTTGYKLNPLYTGSKIYDLSIMLYAVGDGSAGTVSGSQLLAMLNPSDIVTFQHGQVLNGASNAVYGSCNIIGTDWSALQGISAFYLVHGGTIAARQQGNTTNCWISFGPAGPAPVHLGQPAATQPGVYAQWDTNSAGALYTCALQFRVNRTLK